MSQNKQTQSKRASRVRKPLVVTTGVRAGGKYAIELDNASAGWIQSVEGGHATAE